MDQDRRQDKPLIKALVVDDSTTLRRLMELLLVPLGVEMDFVDNGEQAVELAKRNDYDIVFLDILLPGIDGYRVCKTIKSDKRMKDMRVVMLTSQSSAIDKVRGMMAGTDVYLTKPVDRTNLLRAMDKCLPHAVFSQNAQRLAAGARR